MLSRIVLPVRPKPYTSTSDAGSPRGYVSSDAAVMSHGSRRPRVYSQAMSTLKEADTTSDRRGSGKENLRFYDSLPSHLRSAHNKNNPIHGFDPADSNTWGVGSSSLSRNGLKFPFSQRSQHYARDQTRQNHDDHPSLLNSPTNSSPSEVADSGQFIKMIKDGLQLEPQRSDSLTALHPKRTRSTSSSYDSERIPSTRIDSPTSAVHVNKLSTCDLARFSQANDRLSNLRSSSPLSLARISSDDTNGHDVLQDASAAITQWRGEPRFGSVSFNKYALSDSSDEFPADPVPQLQAARDSSPDSLDETIANAYRSDEINARSAFDAVQAMRQQYDGVADTHHNSSQDELPRRPPLAPADAMPLRQSKRKASTFSLRSLTKSLTKRPRLGFQRLAHTIRYESSRHFTQAKLKWRHQTAAEKSHFAAWKANRRRDRPADPLKGKSEKGFGIFSLERSRYGHEEWWRDGVERYRAPSWMLFQR